MLVEEFVPLLAKRLGQVPACCTASQWAATAPCWAAGQAATASGENLSRAGLRPSQMRFLARACCLTCSPDQLRDAGTRLSERPVSLSHSLRSAPPPAVLGLDSAHDALICVAHGSCSPASEKDIPTVH
jgi:hypothetical protein